MTDAPRRGRLPARKQLNRPSWRKARAFVLARDRWECQYCGGTADRVDHVTPPEQYAGGHDDVDNLVACCAACNISKGGLTLEAWYARAGKPLPAWYVPRHPEQPIVDRPAPGLHGYGYHWHVFPSGSETVVGNMGIGWSGDGCPPGCPLTRREATRSTVEAAP